MLGKSKTPLKPSQIVETFLIKFMQLDQRSLLILLSIILMLAIGLRFYQLGAVPHGMSWDEAAIGYNGFAIFHTRRDEWLTKLPISFKSFGDFKSPLAIYVNGPFTFLFGMNLWAVRLPFALAGVLTALGSVWLGYLLAKHTLPEKIARVFGLGVGLLMAVSPWAVFYSRIAFESGLALCLVVWGVACLLSFVGLPIATSKVQQAKQQLVLFIAVLFFVASFYTYHSAKIFVPLLLIVFCILYWPKLAQKIRSVLGGALVGVVLLLPLLKDTVAGNGGSRFFQATLFGQHLTTAQLLQSLISHFMIHFSLGYLVFGQTVNLRQGDGHWGVLLITELGLALLGVVFLIKQVVEIIRTRQSVVSRTFPSSWREMLFAGAWVVAGTLPAVIGTDVPHSNRGLLALPGFLVLAAFGFYYLMTFLRATKLDLKVSGSKHESHLLMKMVAGLIILFHSLLVASYLHDYYCVFAKSSANDFQDGYIQAFQYAVKNEAAADQIIVSDKYGQAYIFALFVRKTNPIWYQGGIMSKYLYLPKISEADLGRKNTVIIATPEQISPKLADKLVYGSDGQIKFVLVKTK